MIHPVLLFFVVYMSSEFVAFWVFKMAEVEICQEKARTKAGGVGHCGASVFVCVPTGGVWAFPEVIGGFENWYKAKGRRR